MKKFSLLVFAISAFSLKSWAGNISYTCFAGKIDKISVSTNRVTSKCVATNENQPFVKELPFASASIDQKGVELMLQLLMKAKESNKNVLIHIDEDPRNNPAGCEGNNCRKLVQVTLE